MGVALNPWVANLRERCFFIRNILKFCNYSMFAQDRGMPFFAMPLSQTWLAIPFFQAMDSKWPLQTKKRLGIVAQGQALLCFEICPKKSE